MDDLLYLSRSNKDLQYTCLDMITPYLSREPKTICDIYQGYIYADCMDLFVTSNQQWTMSDYSSIYGWIGCLYRLIDYKSRFIFHLPPKLPNHSYISKSLIYINTRNVYPILRGGDLMYYEIYRYYMEGIPLSKEVRDTLKGLDRKEKLRLTKIFQDIYQIKLTYRLGLLK